MKKIRKTSEYYRKLSRSTEVKLIRFYARTWENLCKAIEALKSRYRVTVKLLKHTSMGAGLLSGSIAVA